MRARTPSPAPEPLDFDSHLRRACGRAAARTFFRRLARRAVLWRVVKEALDARAAPPPPSDDFEESGACPCDDDTDLDGDGDGGGGGDGGAPSPVAAATNRFLHFVTHVCPRPLNQTPPDESKAPALPPKVIKLDDAMRRNQASFRHFVDVVCPRPGNASPAASPAGAKAPFSGGSPRANAAASKKKRQRRKSNKASKRAAASARHDNAENCELHSALC